MREIEISILIVTSKVSKAISNTFHIIHNKCNEAVGIRMVGTGDGIGN